MIFCARKLIEKALEHNTKMFVLIVDLKKAYDSVPRKSLWSVMKKCGIPPTMLRVVRSLHDGMQQARSQRFALGGSDFKTQ